MEFRIVPDRSSVSVDARSSLHPIHSKAVGVEGTVTAAVDGGAVAVEPAPHARLRLAVEALSAGDPLSDREFRRTVDARRHLLDRPQFPHREREAAGVFRVEVELEIRGVRRPVAGEATVVLRGDALTVDGEGTLDMRDFGVKPPRLLMLRVHPEVVVRVHLEAAAVAHHP
jgi:hypothetical protein